MNFDRGFIKWQPFNSVINSKEVLNDLKQEKLVEKPILFPEEQENLKEKIIDAYYSKSKIKMEIFENNKRKIIETNITKINSYNNTLVIDYNHIISFNQIIHIF